MLDASSYYIYPEFVSLHSCCFSFYLSFSGQRPNAALRPLTTGLQNNPKTSLFAYLVSPFENKVL